jgi:hypothetical protein
MLRSALGVSAVLLASTLTPLAFAAHTHMAPHSTWTLNLGESDFAGGPPMKSDTFVVIADNDKWAKWTDTMVDGDGKTLKSSWSGPEDGSLHPFTGMPGSFSTDAATDVSVMTLPNGTIQTCSFSLNSDKKKYSEKCVAKSKDGKQVNQTLVYDRTK